MRANVEKALMISACVSMLIIPVFIGAGPYIGELIYNNRQSGVYLSFAAAAMLPMSLAMISTSLLNSMGMEKKTLIYYLAGAALLLSCVIFLPRVIGNYGLIAGYLLNFTVNSLFNIRLLKKICCDKLSFVKKQLIALPLLAFCSCLCYFLYNTLANLITPFISLFICCACIPLCLVLLFEIFGVIRVNELIEALLPNRMKKPRTAKRKIRGKKYSVRKAKNLAKTVTAVQDI